MNQQDIMDAFLSGGGNNEKVNAVLNNPDMLDDVMSGIKENPRVFDEVKQLAGRNPNILPDKFKKNPPITRKQARKMKKEMNKNTPKVIPDGHKIIHLKQSRKVKVIQSSGDIEKCVSKILNGQIVTYNMGDENDLVCMYNPQMKGKNRRIKKLIGVDIAEAIFMLEDRDIDEATFNSLEEKYIREDSE